MIIFIQLFVMTLAHAEIDNVEGSQAFGGQWKVESAQGKVQELRPKQHQCELKPGGLSFDLNCIYENAGDLPAGSRFVSQVLGVTTDSWDDFGADHDFVGFLEFDKDILKFANRQCTKAIVTIIGQSYPAKARFKSDVVSRLEEAKKNCPTRCRQRNIIDHCKRCLDGMRQVFYYKTTRGLECISAPIKEPAKVVQLSWRSDMNFRYADRESVRMDSATNVLSATILFEQPTLLKIGRVLPSAFLRMNGQDIPVEGNQTPLPAQQSITLEASGVMVLAKKMIATFKPDPSAWFELRASSTLASKEGLKYSVDQLMDGDLNTAWCADRTKKGMAWVEIRVKSAAKEKKLSGFSLATTNGYWKSSKTLMQNRRVEGLSLRPCNATHAEEFEPNPLDLKPWPMFIGLGSKGKECVRLEYFPVSADSNQDFCISELMISRDPVSTPYW